ncbi:hypothetical protein [Glutamicibacter sp. JC586]|uniref:hypothetical protein n=1 Tax=Glutamicibacter sp. JC586 TaxID=2590552 RepID=UPI00135A3556|nr:hypothetical protein [Glutamicibacter sp. JC586]
MGHASSLVEIPAHELHDPVKMLDADGTVSAIILTGPHAQRFIDAAVIGIARARDNR